MRRHDLTKIPWQWHLENTLRGISLRLMTFDSKALRHLIKVIRRQNLTKGQRQRQRQRPWQIHVKLKGEIVFILDSWDPEFMKMQAKSAAARSCVNNQKEVAEESPDLAVGTCLCQVFRPPPVHPLLLPFQSRLSTTLLWRNYNLFWPKVVLRKNF